MARFSPFETSLWYATAQPAPELSPLRGETRADVCVVGGGLTGLTTALELAQADFWSLQIQQDARSGAAIRR